MLKPIRAGATSLAVFVSLFFTTVLFADENTDKPVDDANAENVVTEDPDKKDIIELVEDEYKDEHTEDWSIEDVPLDEDDSDSENTALAAEGGEDGSADDADKEVVSKLFIPASELSVPGASTTFSVRQLVKRGVLGLADLESGNTGGLLIQPSSFNSANLGLTLRGIGGTTPHQATGDSGVGVFIDGTYIARTQGLSLDLLDIDTLEIARGSQAILGGRNTSGGAVYLSSNKPTGEFNIEQKVLIGDVGDETSSITHINFPLFADVLAIKLSYLTHQHDGWVDNVIGTDFSEPSNSNNFWLRDNEGTRFAVRLDEGGRFIYDYSFLDAEIQSTIPYFQVLSDGGPIAVENTAQDSSRSSLSLPKSQIDITHHNQTVTVRGDKATVTGNIAFRQVDSQEFSNFDINGVAGLLGPGVTATGASGNRLEQDQFTQKLQVNTQFFNDRLDFTAGIQNFHEEVDLIEDGNLGSSEVDSFALFAQGIIALSDRAALSLGWRETRDEKQLQSINLSGVDTGVLFDIEDDNTDSKISLGVDVTDNLNLYISFATGFKSAGASLFSNSLTSLPRLFSPYEAEKTRTSEMGFNGELFNKQVTFSVVGFSTDVTDRQVEIKDPNNLRLSDVVNDQSGVTVEGLELDLTFNIANRVLISGYYAYTDAEDSVVIDPYTSQSVVAHFANTPKHSGSLAVDSTIRKFDSGDLNLHVEYRGFNDYFFDTLNPEVGSRDVFNARIALSGLQFEGGGTIEVGLWINNFTDNDYLETSEFVNRSATAYTAGAFGESRTFGIDLHYQHR